MESIAEVLDSFVDERGMQGELDRVRLRQKWETIAGDPMARHLSVASLERGVLTLAADDPSWGQEASLQRETLRRAVNDHFGREIVTDVRVRQ